MKKEPFTLIELLVVVAIIGILASILAPGLANAREKAKLAVCTSNEKQAGIAFELFILDHNDKYPSHGGSANFMGKQGTYGRYGSRDAPDTRPLNEYMDEQGLAAECPGDKGDSDGITGTAFDNYGVSYRTAWQLPIFGIGVVTANNASNTAMITSFDEPSKKFVLADWIWHFNRDVNNPVNQWHNKTGQRKLAVLFADGHVKFTELPLSLGLWTTPDSSRGFY
jgi:prepilin-type N-terminal cleavage/methylation domain-containing protein/prepilin-type processing-associated H-X9-DG protein